MAAASTRHRATFGITRVYDEPRLTRGYRVLVDRLWPRGLKKQAVAYDEWLKDLAPTTDLRRWYGHDPAKFDEFARRYRAELRKTPAAEAVAHLLDVAGKKHSVTLLTATKDVDHSGARVLLDHLTTCVQR